MREPTWIPLPDAAQRLGLSWAQAWRLVLRGDLKGEQRGSARWWVSVASLEKYEQSRPKAKAVAS